MMRVVVHFFSTERLRYASTGIGYLSKAKASVQGAKNDVLQGRPGAIGPFEDLHLDGETEEPGRGMRNPLEFDEVLFRGQHEIRPYKPGVVLDSAPIYSRVAVVIREGPEPGNDAAQSFDGLPEGVGLGNPGERENLFPREKRQGNLRAVRPDKLRRPDPRPQQGT